MKIKIFFCFFLLIYWSIIFCQYAHSAIKETYTSLGKVIVGLDTEEALDRFGLPASVSNDLWYYSSPEKFFVYLPNVISIHLYPKFCNATVGTPLELKAFKYLSNFQTQDITQEAEFSINEPQDFVIAGPGVIIPKKKGEYQILAKFKNVSSNPIYVTVKESSKESKEMLISIDILPYKPRVSPGGRINFVALGTFFDYPKYYVRDISEQAMWFIQKDEKTFSADSNEIIFYSPATYKVFCKYKDLESFPQEVRAENLSLPVKRNLKHITLLPELITSQIKNTVTLEAFGSYQDNYIEDLTPKVNWRVKDNNILEIEGMGNFMAKSTGATEVTAELDTIESLSSKIIIADKGGPWIEVSGLPLVKETQESSNDLMEEIKTEFQKSSEDIIREGKRLRIIEIVPEYLTISVGEKADLVAKGVYSDNSEEDLTLLGKWISSDEKVANVYKGKLSALSVGDTNVYMEFQGVKSIPSLVKVNPPRLISIILTPPEAKITMKEELQLKAEGYFSDNSRKDITSLTAWSIAGHRIIKIDKGKVKPLRFGKTSVSAEYSGIKSLPASIKVIITMEWVILMILRAVLFLSIVIAVAFLVLYILTVKEKRRLLSLYQNPKIFVIDLYENLKKILAIFGLKYELSVAPLTYAESVENKLSIGNNIFLRFTGKFEEAKYSHHILQENDSYLVLNDYSNFLKTLFSKYNSSSIFLRRILSLIYRIPLIISK